MKAIILCAGEGTRMRPLTYSSAKHLIPLANKPVIEHSITAIRESGIKKIGIVVSPHREQEFKATLGNGTPWDVKLEYILQHQPKGLAHAVSCAKEFIGKDAFLVYLGDNLLENGVKDLVEEFEQSSASASILLAEVEDPRSFGVARLENGQIKQLIEKPKEPPSNLAIVGVYLFDQHIFDAISQIKPSWRGELEITDAIQRLIDEGHRVLPHLVKGWWKDVGNPEDMLHANRLILEKLETDLQGELKDSQIKGRVVVAQGAKIKCSELRGPLIIGPDSVIEDSFIGPFTAIGRDVNIKNSEIEYSIVMEGSLIESVGRRIDHSLIGRNVKICRRDRLPDAFNFVLADNSQVKLI